MQHRALYLSPSIALATDPLRRHSQFFLLIHSYWVLFYFRQEFSFNIFHVVIFALFLSFTCAISFFHIHMVHSAPHRPFLLRSELKIIMCYTSMCVCRIVRIVKIALHLPLREWVHTAHNFVFIIIITVCVLCAMPCRAVPCRWTGKKGFYTSLCTPACMCICGHFASGSNVSELNL